jgi:trans-2,3-dihydro-3-hydroxyanthranilate isomerase
VDENIEQLAAFDPLALGMRPAAGLRRYLLVDVFTQAPLEGNGLGVFTDGRDVPTETMQRLARELNLSETVFVLPPEEGGEARLRIFTPTRELPFAGHPVLGAAFIAGSALQRDAIGLETAAGLVHVDLSREDDRVAFGRMGQPIPWWRPFDRETELLRALGVRRSGLPVELYCNGPLHVYVELEDEPAVAALRPDMTALADVGEVAVSCFAGSGERWKTRMFAPALGVPEDPATGSAAGPLALHLSRHGRIAFGEEIRIRQGAEIGRPSLLYARAEGSPENIERVEVGGSAVIVGGGAFLIDA